MTNSGSRERAERHDLVIEIFQIIVACREPSKTGPLNWTEVFEFLDIPLVQTLNPLTGEIYWKEFERAR